MNLDEVMEQIRSAAEAIASPISAGALASGESTALQLITDTPEHEFYSRDEERVLAVTFLVKRSSQANAMRIAQQLGQHFGRKESYPKSDLWQITRAKHLGTTLVDQEESTRMWIFAVNIDIYIHF